MQLFGTKEQKFLYWQRDRLKILPRAGTGRDSLSQSGTGWGTRQSPIFCQNPGRDRDGTGQSLIFPTIFCFRTSFSCLRTSFSCFFVSLGRWFCPGTFRDRGFCPGTFAPALARDKGTTGRPLLVFPGTSHGTYRPLETLVRVQGGNWTAGCLTCVLIGRAPWNGRLHHAALFL